MDFAGPRRSQAAGKPRSRGRLRRVLDYGLAAVVLGLLVLIAARVDRVEMRSESGVGSVADGDTLTVGGQRVRLRGIDAPEYNQMCRRDGKEYRCGREASVALKRAIGDSPVVCEGWERDRYGRLLAVCRAGDTNLNYIQVRAGWAVAFGDFEDTEMEARRENAGMWAGEFDRPRAWRDAHGDVAEGAHDLVASVVNWLRAIFGTN